MIVVGEWLGSILILSKSVLVRLEEKVEYGNKLLVIVI